MSSGGVRQGAAPTAQSTSTTRPQTRQIRWWWLSPTRVLEASRRPGGLNAPDQPFGDQDAEGVVHRLERDGADLGPDDLGHAVGRDVGLTRDRPQDGQALGRDLDAALTKEASRVGQHARSITQFFESFKGLPKSPPDA